MIIRATCHDNDFSYDILKFFKNLPYHIHDGINKRIDEYEMTFAEKDDEKIEGAARLYHQYRVDSDRYVKIYQSDEWSEEDKEWVISKIRDSLRAYIASLPQEEYCDTPQSNADYVYNHLSIEILDTFKDEWENGEVVYWFQHSNQAFAQ